MTYEHALKLLTVGDDTELIAINRKAAEDLSGYLETLHRMLLGVEECEQTADEFRDMLVRLYPDTKQIMQHTVGVNRVMVIVAEHLFLTGTGDPQDMARFRFQCKTLNETGKLSLKM